MKFFDVGAEAKGFIAVGGIATGVFALGQIAFGVVAVGQGAVGLIAVGQGAVGLVALGQGSAGLVSIGMGSAGLYWCGAMIGVGGRGLGGVVQLTPWLGPASEPPDTTTLSAVRDGTPGWVPLDLDDGGTKLVGAGERVRMDARLVAAARAHGDEPVFAWLEHDAHGFVATKLMERRPPRWRQLRFWRLWAIQLTMLIGLAFAIWIGVIDTIGAALWSLVR